MEEIQDEDRMNEIIKDLWENVMMDYMCSNKLGYILDTMRYQQEHDEKCFREFEELIMDGNNIIFEEIEDDYESESENEDDYDFI